MKKLIIIIIGIILLPIITLADHTERVEIESVDNGTRNIVINREDEKWLLHTKGCKDFKNEEEIYLTIYGELDGYRDTISVNSYQKCDVDQAELITGIITPIYTYPSRTESVIKNKNGDIYNIRYGEDCRGISGYKNKDIYLYQFGNEISKYDKIFLPRNRGECYLETVDKREIKREVRKRNPKKDTTMPRTINTVRAIPNNGGAYLYWKKGSDNIGIDHYIISYSKYEIDTKEWEFENMVNKTETKEINYKFDNLENEETYYFYILAVDTSGNRSSQWSNVATATPKSSISPRKTYSKSEYQLNLRKISENKSTIIVRWYRPKANERQTIILEVDGEREITSTDFQGNYFRIMKRTHRKGKDIKFTIRSYDFRGQMIEETIEFNF